MKKKLLSTILVFTAFALNAQVYLGGQLGFNLQNSATSQGYENSNYNSTTKNIQFAFGPEVGYSINDKLDVGVNLSISFGNSESSDASDYYSYSTKTNSLGWAAAPYVRYSFVKFGKFKILGKASFFAEGTKNNQEYKYQYIGADYNTTQTNSGRTNSLGINISPLITFQASKHFVLLADLNFLGLHLAFNKTTSDTNTNKSTDFGFNINTNNLLNIGSTTIVDYTNNVDYLIMPVRYTTVGGFKIGFAYIF
jgi:hypothetical protein